MDNDTTHLERFAVMRPLRQQVDDRFGNVHHPVHFAEIEIQPQFVQAFASRQPHRFQPFRTRPGIDSRKRERPQIVDNKNPAHTCERAVPDLPDIRPDMRPERTETRLLCQL